MIDHLLVFADEAAGQAALPDYCPLGVWRGDCCIPGVLVYQVTGSELMTDPTTGEEYEREMVAVYPGWFVLIARPELDLSLHELDACCLVRDREASTILFTAPDIEPPLDGAVVSPQFA